ncbi:MAG: ThuA domain-containing protein [Pseudomonadota bacterium]
MRRSVLIVLLVMSSVLPSYADSPEPREPLRVLMTVGGVGYDTSIVRLLRRHRSIDLTVRDIDVDAVVFDPAQLSGMDAVLMYHRDNVAERGERDALLDFVSDGGGIVVLHHSIANYPDWIEWWQDHVGGLYVLPGHPELPPSEYFPDFKGVARPSSDHPITARLGDFWRYADESYDRLWVSDSVEALLQTTAYGSENRLAWIGPSASRRIVFVQPGHGAEVLTDPKFIALIEDALRWVARDNK